MYGVHPRTQKQIRLVTLQGSLNQAIQNAVGVDRSCDEKWQLPPRFNRMQIITDNWNWFKRWWPIPFRQRGSLSAILVCVNPDHVDTTTLKSFLTDWKDGEPNRCTAIVLSRAILDAMAIEHLDLPNLIVADDMPELFPHVETKGESLETMLESLLTLFRINRFYTRENSPLFTAANAAALWQTRLQARVIAIETSSPPPIVLIQQYYISPDNRRAKEIHECLRRNCDNPWIDGVLLLNEQFYQEASVFSKVRQVTVGARLTYKRAMLEARKMFSKDALFVFANSDIYYDDTLRHLYSIDWETDKPVLALLRYEVSADPEVQPALFGMTDGKGPRPDSQDTWILHSRLVGELEPDMSAFEFTFGQPACDHVFAYEMIKRKYTVANPAHSIRSFHLHTSGVRNYNFKNAVERDVYAHIVPTFLQAQRVVREYPADAAKLSLGPITTCRRGFACDNERRKGQWVHAVAKDTGVHVDSMADFTPGKGYDTATVLKDVCCTSNGFVFDFTRAYAGQGDLWAEAQFSHLRTTVHVPTMIAAYLSPAMAANPWHYMAHYLARAFVIQRINNQEACFVMPENVSPDDIKEDMADVRVGSDAAKVAAALLAMVKWPSTVAAVAYEPDVNIHADKMIVTELVHRPKPLTLFPLAQDLLTLREKMGIADSPSVQNRPDSRKVLVTVGNDAAVAAAVGPYREAEDVEIVSVNANTLLATARILLGYADIVLVGRDAEPAMVALFAPVTAHVIEVQDITATRCDMWHYAGVLGMTYTVAPLEREPDEEQAKYVGSVVQSVVDALPKAARFAASAKAGILADMMSTVSAIKSQALESNALDSHLSTLPVFPVIPLMAAKVPTAPTAIEPTVEPIVDAVPAVDTPVPIVDAVPAPAVDVPVPVVDVPVPVSEPAVEPSIEPIVDVVPAPVPSIEPIVDIVPVPAPIVDVVPVPVHTIEPIVTPAIKQTKQSLEEAAELAREMAAEWDDFWTTTGVEDDLAALPESQKPLIVLPAEAAITGLHVHDNDMFREMVRLWEKKRWVRVLRTPRTPFLWWGGIGHVLLYDRPITKWLQYSRPPQIERLLTGNPTVKDIRQLFPRLKDIRPWIFWSRHPGQLETLANLYGQRDWADRTIESQFVGKCESELQVQNRTKHAWESGVSLWVMAKKDEKHRYTHEEFLKLLSQTRFGLSLAGYGNKCNREIEYMAMGVVPLVAPEVDMTSFAHPPQEGVHFLRVQSPADIQKVIKSVNEMRWRQMSRNCHEWWRQYASVRGAFDVTRRLATAK